MGCSNQSSLGYVQKSLRVMDGLLLLLLLMLMLMMMLMRRRLGCFKVNLSELAATNKVASFRMEQEEAGRRQFINTVIILRLLGILSYKQKRKNRKKEGNPSKQAQPGALPRKAGRQERLWDCAPCVNGLLEFLHVECI